MYELHICIRVYVTEHNGMMLQSKTVLCFVYYTYFRQHLLPWVAKLLFSRRSVKYPATCRYDGSQNKDQHQHSHPTYINIKSTYFVLHGRIPYGWTTYSPLYCQFGINPFFFYILRCKYYICFLTPHVRDFPWAGAAEDQPFGLLQSPAHKL